MYLDCRPDENLPSVMEPAALGWQVRPAGAIRAGAQGDLNLDVWHRGHHLRRRDRPVDPACLKAMGDAIAHRGPDAEGFWIEPGVGLVHRRLSIIDLAGGDQPIGNEDGSIQVVFNGEIYNYQELRAGPGSPGAPVPDPERHRGPRPPLRGAGRRLVERLRGMFAFALWDRPRRRLVLARDRLGHQAALRLPRRGEAALRLRAQGDPGLSRACRARSIPRRWRITSPSAWSRAIGRSSEASRSSRRHTS